MVFVSLSASLAVTSTRSRPTHTLTAAISLTRIIIDWILWNSECAMFSAHHSVSQHAISIWPIEGSISIWLVKAHPRRKMVYKGNHQRDPHRETAWKRRLRGNPAIFLAACPESIYEYFHRICEMGPLQIRCGKADDEGIGVLWLLPTLNLCLCRKLINRIPRVQRVHSTEYQRWQVDLHAGVWRLPNWSFPQGHVSAS